MSDKLIKVNISPLAVETAYNETLTSLVDTRFISRLWSHDTGLFGEDADRKAVVANRLGWLDSPAWLGARIDELSEFALDIQVGGFTHIVLLGMGGSSLCPEVLARMFGLPAYLKTFDIVDATDPVTIARIESKIELQKTLFVVASKSGSTTETRSQAAYFLDKVGAVSSQPGSQFIAITDPNSALHQWAERDNFRAVFLNPADIGGRYSALSYFGMIPAALLQVPLAKFAAGAIQIAAELHVDSPDNVALQLGSIMACMAQAGRDKLTFLTSDKTDHAVPWIEQLIAESTGKEGKGVIPIEGEAVGKPEQYGTDRTFCRMRMANTTIDSNEAQVAADIDIVVPDAICAGALFLLWEVAVSVAGHILGINPYDEPNVQESKDITNRLLATMVAQGHFDEVGRKVSGAACDVWSLGVKGDSLAALCESFTTSMNPGDYCALLYFGDRTDRAEQWLGSMRTELRDAQGVATLRGYGPRYLHSIGQLYKGGRQNGHFVVFTTDQTEERAIPGESFSFSALLQAQALGDTEALSMRGRPVLHVRLKRDIEVARREFASAWSAAQRVATT